MTTAVADLAGREWFTPEQAAVYSGWSTKTILRALRAGELAGTQRSGAGGRWRIHRDDIDAWNRGEHT